MSPSPRVVRSFRLALTAAVLLVLHLATTDRSYPLVADINDKINHLAAFYGLALLADFAAPDRRFGWRKGLALLAFGGLIELIQAFLPYRESSLLDLLADAVALVLYAVTQGMWQRLLGWRRQEG